MRSMKETTKPLNWGFLLAEISVEADVEFLAC